MTSPEPLSKREQEVAALLLQAKSNKQIALNLGISERTVEFHLSRIYAKLHVASRTEAIIELGKTPGNAPGGNPGESTVERVGNGGDNHDGTLNTSGEASPPTGRYFVRYRFLIVLVILSAVIVVIWLLKPAPWQKYERECEYPNESTVGQMLTRTYASASMVHGQFGTTAAPPWDAIRGEVVYRDIELPQLDPLYLQLRYSKYSNPAVPILVYLDDEPEPVAAVYLEDQGSWEQFAWTERIPLGAIEAGVHSIKFATGGQQYGVADLDKFTLTGPP